MWLQIRLWDVEIALARDDATSLNVNGGQKSVCVLRDQKGIKTGATCATWHPEGGSMMAGGRDGSLQLWEFRSGAYKPVVLLPRGAPKSEMQYAQVKPMEVTRGAHAAGCDISCIKWHSAGHMFASRSTNGTIKVRYYSNQDTVTLDGTIKVRSRIKGGQAGGW